MSLIAQIRKKSSSFCENRAVCWSFSKRTLSISPKIVSWAILRAFERAEAVTSLETSTQNEMLSLRLSLMDGKVIDVDIVPERLELTTSEITACCRIPEGIRIGHESVPRSVLFSILDKMLGITSTQVNQIRGVSMEGENLALCRPIGQSAVGAWFVNRMVPHEKTVIPLTIDPSGRLVAELSQVLNSSLRIDIKALLKRDRTI